MELGVGIDSLSAMKPHHLNWLLLIVAFIMLYVGSYFAYRSAHTEVWARDGQSYVIFPPESRIVYYGYRPLMYLDIALTGMRFHIGPRQE